MVLVAIFLVAVGRHLSPQDPQVAAWFDEYFRMWGVSYDELMRNHFRASWCRVGTLTSTYSRAFCDNENASQVRRGFDYDMDFGIPGNSDRSISSSDTSSNGQSTDTRRITDGTASHISTDPYFTRHDPQSLRDSAGSLGPPGRLMKVILPDIRFMREEEATQGFGALAAAAGINDALHSCSSSRGCSHTAERGVVDERMLREQLPALMTDGLTGQSPKGLNSQDFYARMAHSSCTGVSEESGR